MTGNLRARIEALASNVSEMAAAAREAEFYGAREGADDLRGVAKLIRDLLAALPAEQPAALTVGAALRWTHAAEYVAPSREDDTGPCWCQAAGGSWRFWRLDAVGGPRWSSWMRDVPDEDLAAPCRMVPLAEADADPAGRGGL